MTTKQKNIATAIIILFALLLISVGAQQPKPTEFRLNPEASKVWNNIDQAEAELQRQFQQLESQRATLLIGAGVPNESRQCKTDDKGIVVCVKPEQAKASPEKKQ